MLPTAKALILLGVANLPCVLVAAPNQSAEIQVDSVCFNNCSGHGTCKDFVCECDVGYEGDDCRFCFADEGDVVPILSAGHVNLTSANFAETLRKGGTLLIAASSRSCHKCIRYEAEYQGATADLEALGVQLGRIDADQERQLLYDVVKGQTAAAQHLPIVALITQKRKSKALLYEGPHERHAITEFVRKQRDPPTRRLRSVAEVEAFFQDPRNGYKHTSTTAIAVVGFFSDALVMEEDEMEDFMEAAVDLKLMFDLYLGVVDDATVSEHFKKLGWILRTPEVVLKRPGVSMGPSLHLQEILEENASIKDWILKESMPLVGRLTHGNFPQYERTRLPMLIMFLELPDIAAGDLGTSVSGMSGGVSNRELIKELEEVALEHRGRISCLYADGVAFADSMKTLGLFGSRERLPQLGFNTRDGRQLPFPENLPINRETLLQFTSAFLSGRMQRSQDAQKAMVSAVPYSKHNTARRKTKRKSPPEVPGVSEQLKPQDAIFQVTRNTFEHEVLDDSKDVIIFFYSKECESCSHFLPYYKRVGERFKNLAIPSVMVAAMDVTEESPPSDFGITLPPLPAIVLLPAEDKGPPFRFFSGVGKVGPIMRWIHTHASVRFELPVLPHLSEEEKPLFREQVRRREEQQATSRKRQPRPE